MCVAVLDIGKTNLKLEVFDQSGAPVFRCNAPNGVRVGPPYPHADLEGIWDFAVSALAEAAGDFVISDVVVATHGATAVVMAGENLALPVLDYEAAEPEQLSAEYDALARDFAATLSPGLPVGLNLGRQLYWQARHFPDRFALATSIPMYPQYWAWRLSGVLASEVTSLGCHSDLWEPAAGGFSRLVHRMGWEKLFPPLRSAWDVLGTLRPEVAQATGISPNCRVRCGIHDSNASYLPHRLRMGEKPFTLVSTGTWVVVMAAGGSHEALSEADDMLANVDAWGQAVPCARFMGGREFETLCQGPPVPIEVSDISALVAAGTLALPAFSSAGGPYRHNPGRIIGPLPQTPEARTALASLYVALMITDLVKRLDSTGDILLEGPFARSPVIPSLLATLLPHSSIVVMAEAGTAAGTALLGNWPQIPPTDDKMTTKPLPIDRLMAYAEQWRKLACLR